MSKTRIFLSSTCFDLLPIREEIRNCILEMGHEPLLSEYPSFPVFPDLRTIENCRKSVRDNTDIFILIVGGRRGSLDPTSKKPITNIEYEAAKENEIDSFIFVSKPVFNLLHIWEKNPTADFMPDVDFPEVFQFIKNIMGEQKWIFTFDKIAEIKEILKNQLSIYLRYLIDKKRQGKLTPLKEFLNESRRAQEIALEKPRFWEYLLTEELLRSKLSDVDRKFSELERGLVFRKSKKIGGKEFIDYTKLKFNDIISLIDLIKITIEKEIPFSWGKPGEPGDCIEIKRTVDKIIEACNEYFEWEADLHFIDVPGSFIKSKQILEGCTSQIISEIKRIPDEIGKIFQQENPEGRFEINLVFKSPDNLDAFNKEINRLVDNPEAWIHDYN